MGTIQALARAPVAGSAGVCFAPQLGGVRCRREDESTWEPQNAGLDGANVVALAAEPASPGGLLAVTAGGAVYRRAGAVWELVNDGSAWGALSTSFLDRPFGVLLVPARGLLPTRLYLGAGTTVFRSDDGGGSWHLVLTTAAPVSDLAVDPLSPGIVFVAWGQRPSFGPGGLLKSADGGVTWTPVGPPGGWPYGALTVALASGSAAAPAAVYASPGYPGLFRSRDRGVTWEALATGEVPSVRDLVPAIALDPVSPATLIAARADGVFLSPDGGDTWRLFGGRQAPFVPSDVTRLVVGPGARRVYASTGFFGLFSTADRGRQWTLAYRSQPLGNLDGGRLRFDPANPATVYALLGGDAYRSRDGGGRWESLNALSMIGDLAFAPATPGAPAGTLYAASWFGLLASEDGGATWRTLDPHEFFAVAALGAHTLLVGACGAALSRDGGRTLTPTLSCDDPGDGSHPADFSRVVDAFEVDPADSRKIYARVSEFSGINPPTRRVFRSANGGLTWRPVLDGSDVVAIEPSRRGIVYLLAGAELQRSSDHGRSFTRIPTTGLADFKARDLAVDPASPAILYAAGEGGVRRSADGGRTWETDDHGLAAQPPFYPPGALAASGVFFSPAVPGVLFVAANGVFYTRALP